MFGRLICYVCCCLDLRYLVVLLLIGLILLFSFVFNDLFCLLIVLYTAGFCGCLLVNLVIVLYYCVEFCSCVLLRVISDNRLICVVWMLVVVVWFIWMFWCLIVDLFMVWLVFALCYCLRLFVADFVLCGLSMLVLIGLVWLFCWLFNGLIVLFNCCFWFCVVLI